ncbi:hypothetical protein SHELI_v1c09380 [Spiroplasma helicoides]|uniref:Lipoprotein n=1 Tax=Spiroplasma helicoides TaxID=216938 RepID=A0A1B3SLU5_9MOLU|nr:lipoprotein [Spiroplasma helicoides]AOG60887.1 hypothetical protein SHELI_v1c09380 [Spiroplasma helicoides]
MKKLLSILATTGLVASSSSVAVACNKNNASDKDSNSDGNGNESNDTDLDFGQDFKDQQVRIYEGIWVKIKVSKPKKGAEIKASNDSELSLSSEVNKKEDTDGSGEFVLKIRGLKAKDSIQVDVTYNEVRKSINVKVYEDKVNPYFMQTDDCEIPKQSDNNKNFNFPTVELKNSKAKDNDKKVPAVNFSVKSSDENIVKSSIKKELINSLNSQTAEVVLEGVNEGQANITVSYNDTSMTFTVTVGNKYDLGNLVKQKFEVTTEQNNEDGIVKIILAYLESIGYKVDSFPKQLVKRNFKAATNDTQGQIQINAYYKSTLFLFNCIVKFSLK